MEAKTSGGKNNQVMETGFDGRGEGIIGWSFFCQVRAGQPERL